MDRKINFAKITSKSAKIAVATPVKSTSQAQPSTASPYFSPIAHRTRNNRKDDGKQKVPVAGSKLLTNATPSSVSETIKNIEKNVNGGGQKARKHIKVDYDENTKPVVGPVKIKSEITDPEYDEAEQLACPSIEIKTEIDNDTAEDVKQTKKGKKRPSNSQNTEAFAIDIKQEVKLDETIKREESVKSESTDSPSGEKHAKWEPKHWRQLLANIREMRKERNAPVDTMGCDKCYDEHSDEKTKRYHHLIALMLSSQTKDGVTYAAMDRLKTHGLTPEKMVEISTGELEQLLYPVSFYKTKAKNIQKAAQLLIDQYNSDIPNDIKGLVSLPGVGPKMAHICMRVAWNVITGAFFNTQLFTSQV